MNRSRMFLFFLVGALLMAGAAALTGVIPLSRARDSARPPCEQLPDRKSVADAMASHQDLVTRIQHVGPGVKVKIATPCKGRPDRAIVSITYRTDTEWKGVDAILRQEGFGVAVELISH